MRWWIAGPTLLLIARGGLAQLTVEQVPRERTVSTADEIQGELDSARWRLGPLAVTPMIEVSEAGYDNNVFSSPDGDAKVGDWTATVGLGGRGLLPIGRNLFLRAVALPQYSWYDKLKDRRVWESDYEASFLGLGNRLSFEFGGSLNKGLTLLSTETLATVLETTKDTSGKVEVGLTGSLSFVGGAEFQTDRFSAAGAPPGIGDVRGLDRTDSAALAGLRLRLPASFAVNAGMQGTRSLFREDPTLRNNQSFAYLGGISYDRPRLFVNVTGGYRKGEPYGVSAFPNYTSTVGSYFASFFIASPIELQAYGHRIPQYSLSNIRPVYIESRFGGGVRFRIGRRVLLGGYAEAGTNEYPFLVTTAERGPKRIDDAVNYGGNVAIQLFRTAVFRVNVYDTAISPRDPTSKERNILKIVTGFSFSGDLTK